MSKIELLKVIDEVKEAWQIKDIVQVHDTTLRIAKIDGAYQWHSHQKEDELFIVLKGRIVIDLEEGPVELKEMESFLVKRGTRHRSRSEEPSWVLLIEPSRTKTRGET